MINSKQIVSHYRGTCESLPDHIRFFVRISLVFVNSSPVKRLEISPEAGLLLSQFFVVHP